MKKQTKQVYELLREQHPDARPELDFRNRFELIIAVILSAQCTDARVNKVTEVLFRRARTPQELADLTQEETEEIIRTCGMYKNKAKFIRETSRILAERHGGEVPGDYNELVKLPGVSRKTANVVLSVGFGIPAIAVDTHVFRVSRRLGLAEGKQVEKVEEELRAAFDSALWNHLHHLLIFHGRYVCNARSPKCEICLLKEYCRAYCMQNFDYK